MSSYVLIHGAGLGGWAWSGVGNALTRQGHEVFRPSLSGQGERSHPSRDVTLHTHIDEIAKLIALEDLQNVVLCGHSYGGMVTTGVADRITNRIATLVYFDALIPKDGQSAAAARRDAAHKTPDAPQDVYRVDPRYQSALNARLTSFPEGCADDPIALSGQFEDVATKIYVRSTRFASVALDWFHAQAAADPAWQTLQIDAGHIPMIDAPDRMVEILAAAAGVA
jgi:pimeloyl-ACP methyl ester carboxylesterase